jgi:LacI family transcriptional regulator
MSDMKPPTRVKLSDVAERAGVSVATVSKVVNGRYGVSKDTIDLVQGIIDEMGYVGNLSAASLRSASTNVLGILVADFEPYSAEIIKGAATVTRGTSWELLSHAGGERHGWERRSIARLGGTLIDGAVVVTPTTSDVNFIVPVVAIDPHYGPNQVPTVDADSFGGAIAAVEHLIGLGHERIAFLGGREELDSSRAREHGFRKAMKAAGLEIPAEYVRESRYDPDAAEAIALELLSLPQRPTAIFAANDVTAIRVLGAATMLGLRVPQDLSVVGFDDIPQASLSSPALTTVRQPLGAMGQAAMQMLLDILDGKDPDTHVRMNTELVVRASTAAPHA